MSNTNTDFAQVMLEHLNLFLKENNTFLDSLLEVFSIETKDFDKIVDDALQNSKFLEFLFVHLKKIKKKYYSSPFLLKLLHC